MFGEKEKNPEQTSQYKSKNKQKTNQTKPLRVCVLCTKLLDDAKGDLTLGAISTAINKEVDSMFEDDNFDQG